MKWKNIINFLVLVLLYEFWTLGAVPAQASCLLSNQESEAAETLVQVGKYCLNFRVIEGENLTILLEAGGGMDSREWNKLAPELALKTGATIISYDRAGFGKSDLPETPHDMREEVEWLWQGLQKLSLNNDLILVGHSFGGWMIRLFASEHPETVRGMVFVDPFTNEFVDQLGVEYLDNQPVAGKIPFDTSQPDKLTKFQRAVVRMVRGGLDPKMEIMRKTKLPADIPVVVITSGRPFLPKTEDQEAWRLSHEQLTASIKGATLIVAEKSDHMVPGRQPDLVIEAVIKVIKRNPSVLKGPYLGQKPPGMTPEIIAPGILSYDKIGAFCSVFSPDGNEFYYVRFIKDEEGSGRIYWTRRVNNIWAEPEPAPFGSDYPENDMRISPDGNKMFWRSWRSLPGKSDQEDRSCIWYSNRLEDGWSKPQPLKCGNGYLRAGYLDVPNSGTLYFPTRREDSYGEGDIYCSRFINGAYTTPENLGGTINTHYSEGDLCVAPGESFLIVSCWNRPDNRGVSDFYISFRNSNGEWSGLKNMGEPVNSDHEENCPTLSPDGKYFLFNRRNTITGESNIYWVDAKVIENLKPKKLK